MPKGIAVAGLLLAVAATVGAAIGLAVAHQGQGFVLWTERYNGPGNVGDQASSVAVSPDGDTLVVTGLSTGVNGRKDYATIAYSAATGAQLWARLDKPASGYASFYAASALSISPDGRTVLAAWAGQARPRARSPALITVAYRATTGTRLWERSSQATIGSLGGAPAISVSPRGGTVFVSGTGSLGRVPVYDYVTIAYDISTGAQKWERSYLAPSHGSGSVSALAVSPSGTMVYVTGFSHGRPGGAPTDYYTTVAYQAAQARNGFPEIPGRRQLC